MNLIHICIHRRLMSSCTCSAVTLSNLPVCLHLLPKGCLCWKEQQISLKVKLHVPALCGICLLMKDNKKVLLAEMKVQKAKWLKAYYGNRHYQEITKIAQMSFKLREGYIKDRLGTLDDDVLEKRHPREILGVCILYFSRPFLYLSIYASLNIRISVSLRRLFRWPGFSFFPAHAA